MDPFAILRSGLSFGSSQYKQVHKAFEENAYTDKQIQPLRVQASTAKHLRKSPSQPYKRKVHALKRTLSDSTKAAKLQNGKQLRAKISKTCDEHHIQSIQPEEQETSNHKDDSDISEDEGTHDGGNHSSDDNDYEDYTTSEDDTSTDHHQDKTRRTDHVVPLEERMQNWGDKKLRKHFHIHVKGDNIPRPVVAFEELTTYDVPIQLLRHLSSVHPTPTPVQMQCIPALLKCNNVVAVAPTGSGKTCAFSFPLLANLQRHKDGGFRALVLVPTPELAQQIKQEFNILTKHTNLSVQLLTKSNVGVLKKNSFHSHDILISTPMRLVYFLTHEVLDLSQVEWLIIDEADTLFENGYERQLDQILLACSNKKHVSLFSATMPQRVENLARSVIPDFIRVSVGVENAAATTVDQRLVFTGDELGKVHALRNLIKEGIQPPVLIFVQSKERAKHLFHELVYDNINVDVIHAERTNQQRDQIVRAFREGAIWILICTDLMSRGIDFKGVNLVINFDFPPSVNEYIHRVGRTGRAGRRGSAITFFTVKDAPILRAVATAIRSSGCKVPQWIFKLKGL
eukprot:gene7911-10004_t